MLVSGSRACSSPRWGGRQQFLDVQRAVRLAQLFLGGPVAHRGQHVVQQSLTSRILDGSQPLRAFGVVGAHFVGTVGMGDVGAE